MRKRLAVTHWPRSRVGWGLQREQETRLIEQPSRHDNDRAVSSPWAQTFQRICYNGSFGATCTKLGIYPPPESSPKSNSAMRGQ